MRCETCQGRGQVTERVDATCEPTPQFHQDQASLPCPECGGSGITHCCDGLCEQPDRS